jgi:hypothetical protein
VAGKIFAKVCFRKSNPVAGKIFAKEIISFRHFLKVCTNKFFKKMVIICKNGPCQNMKNINIM